MTYRLVIKPSAEKDLERLPGTMQRRIAERLGQIEAHPRGPGTVKLAGTGKAYRVRAGDWRIVYEIDDAKGVVFVTLVAHRSEVYRNVR